MNKKLFKQMQALVSDFDKYKAELNSQDQENLNLFFDDVKNHINLPAHFKNAIISDFEKALIYYNKNGVDLNTALKRLDPAKLGGFYARPATLWFPLDDMAKIYPMSINKMRMSIFRLSIHLKEDIIPEILQMALSFTIKRFPVMSTSMKQGFFWHYLDTTKRHFEVKEEAELPCKPINISGSGSVAFKVLYYKNKISAEVFHALTDGTGGYIFLNTLVAEYLRLLGVDIKPDKGIFDINGIYTSEEVKNEFLQFSTEGKSSSFGGTKALQMSGRISPIRPSRLLHFELNSSKLKEISKFNDVTVTTYILGILFMACKYCCDQTKGIIQLQVPVNLRNYYNTTSLRNFSMYCKIFLNIDQIDTLENILPKIKQQLEEKSSKDAIQGMIVATKKAVKAMRYVPLFVLTPVAKLVYGLLGDSMFTMGFSNLGVMKLPDDMVNYVDKYSCSMSPSKLNRAGCTCITFKDKTIITIIKTTSDPSFEEKIYELITSQGLVCTVDGSEIYEY